MKLTFLLLAYAFFLSTSSFALSLEDQQFEIKQKFEEEAYKLKVSMEKSLLEAEGPKLVSRFFKTDYTSCIGYVMQGSTSRAEAQAACRQVHSMECLDFVYKGPGTRLDAARACAGVESLECLEFVYKGPGSRVEAARACVGVSDMDCVNEVYRGPSSRIQSAQACAESRRRPRPQSCE